MPFLKRKYSLLSAIFGIFKILFVIPRIMTIWIRAFFFFFENKTVSTSLTNNACVQLFFVSRKNKQKFQNYLAEKQKQAAVCFRSYVAGSYTSNEHNQVSLAKTDEFWNRRVGVSGDSWMMNHGQLSLLTFV